MRALGIVITAIAVAPRAAAAAPGDDPMSGHAVFTGAVSPDPTSLVGNPAALDLGREGLHVWFGAMAAIDQLSITLRHEDASGAFTSGDPTNTRTTELGWQAALYEVKSDFAAGFVVDLPPGELFPADRDALRYHTLGGHLRQHTWAGLGGSIRVVDNLYVGGSASYTKTDIALRFARDTALEAGRGDVGTTGLENPAADQIYSIHAADAPFGFSQFAFTLGFAWQLTPSLAIGGYYREPQGFNGAITEPGTVAVTRSPREGGGELDGLAVVSYIPAQRFELGGRLELVPGLRAIAGVRWELTARTQQLDLRMFGNGLADVPDWYPRPRGFHDTWSGWAGVEQADDGQRAVLGARAGISSGAVARERISAQQVEGWNLTADVGAQIRLSNLFVLVASYGARWYVPQDVTASAYDPIARLDCVDSDYDLSTAACQAVRDGYGIDTAAGQYGRWEHTLRLGLRIDLE